MSNVSLPVVFPCGGVHLLMQCTKWRITQAKKSVVKNSIFFQNEGIFVQLDKLDELDKFTHASIRIHLQYQTSTETL